MNNKLNLKSSINIKKILKSLSVLILFFTSSEFKVVFANILKYDIENLTGNQLFVLTAISDIFLFIILFLLYFKDLKEDFKKLKNNLYKNIDIGFKYWLIGLIVMVVSNIFISFFLKEANATNEEMVQQVIGSIGFLSIVIIGIIGPIIEELVFRKAFRDVFRNKYLFIFISGLIFGGLHVILSISSPWDLFYLIPYCSLGIAFGVMYVKTDNIYTSMFMHIFHNTVFTIISIISAGVILW